MKTKNRVMVIEDHDELREATVMALSNAGYDVIGVSCAEDVDDTIKLGPIDLYVVDLNLPEEDGISLTQRLRKAQPKAGIVITTARSRLDDRLIGYESGADIYLSKPVDFKELLAAITNLNRRLAFNDAKDNTCKLDLNNLTITGPQGQCKLSQAEADLMAALTKAQGRTLERWQAMTHLSSGKNELSSNSLQVRIFNLKKKLSTCMAEGDDTIISIRNHGYRLCFELHVVG